MDKYICIRQKYNSKLDTCWQEHACFSPSGWCCRQCRQNYSGAVCWVDTHSSCLPLFVSLICQVLNFRKQQLSYLHPESPGQRQRGPSTQAGTHWPAAHSRLDHSQCLCSPTHQDESCEEEELHPSRVLQRDFYSGDRAPSSSQLNPFFGIFLISAHFLDLFVFCGVIHFLLPYTVPCRVPLALS